jgi:basic amino acid/polyamine antiporter, APA family
MTATAVSSPESSLVRALGVRQLAAGIVNVTVGAGIFVLPAAVAMGLGAAAPLAYVVCAAAMALIVTSFALAGSRVSLTGGIYAYVEVAFGPFVGFLAGVLQWLMLWLTAAGLLSAFADQVGLLVPGAGPGLVPGAGDGQGLPRAAIIVATVLLLALVNVRGVGVGARLIEGAVVAKLLPLAVFLAVGVFFVQPAALAWPGWPPADKLGETVLLLVFAFVGIEVALVPSGEVRDPRRTVPRAIYLALGLTTVLYLAIQAVAQGVLGAEMAQQAEAPLAAASSRFLGAGGRLLMLAGGAVSMFGYLCGDMLSSPRALYAFGRDGFLPRALARVHPSFHTPYVAIPVHALLAAALAVSSSFRHLALLSNVAVLVLYFLCCAAALRLLSRKAPEDEAAFTFPGARVVPVAAMAVIAWILAHATRREFAVLGVTLVVAAALYGVRRLARP